MHSGGFEFTKLTHTRLEDNLIRHRGDRLWLRSPVVDKPFISDEKCYLYRSTRLCHV